MGHWRRDLIVKSVVKWERLEMGGICRDDLLPLGFYDIHVQSEGEVDKLGVEWDWQVGWIGWNRDALVGKNKRLS